VAVTEVSYEPDEVGLEADDRRMRGRVSVCAEGGEVLSGAENILTGLPYSMHLPQELCTGDIKCGKKQQKEKKMVRKAPFTPSTPCEQTRHHHNNAVNSSG